MRFPQSWLLLSLPISLLFPAWMGFAAVSPQLPSSTRVDSRISLEFPPPPNRGAPRSTAGGGVRGEEASCRVGEGTRLTPLIPPEKIGMTAKGNPTIFVYVPQMTATEAEFLLVNRRGQEVYEVKLALPTAPGVVQIRLPESVNLEVGVDYLWQFSVLCDPSDRTSDEFVQGWLQRQELSAEAKARVEATTGLNRAKVYASERIWHETLETLAGLPPADRREWEQLLKSVGLEAIASEPLLECCTSPANPR
ncbi:DUF928 domain-containing protein [Kamptonema cortianum]|uniref:DUF928 domain-containing protein n=1 Tax=Geitlerinema calcuttense NRMC-F 0142 TaxID=2922238 RepID=A0ABT7LXE5_9CYAN|nr:DUF928 domain-containing protein [Geitlerinema calcuttense]MDK3155533.1 DUF928 domain-containing protein [Kamptonema cortianum]MDL5056679.1 DUF928 domain-containing protein [Geitlerinema calcuttense NRMC-F 0142]